MKRKLAWQEEGSGADLAAFDQPMCLGGPGDKRGRDFVAKVDSSADGAKPSKKGNKNDRVKKPKSDEGQGYLLVFDGDFQQQNLHEPFYPETGYIVPISLARFYWWVIRFGG